MLVLSLDLSTGTGQHRRNIERKGPLANPPILHLELSLKCLSGLWYLVEFCRYRKKTLDGTGRKWTIDTLILRPGSDMVAEPSLGTPAGGQMR